MAKTVLLVDDDQLLLEKARSLLQNNGFDVLAASSWSEFMKVFYGGPATPDLILFDINLGEGIPGDKMLQVFKEARKKLATARSTKLILFSGLSEEEIQTRAFLCGAEGYLQKDLLAGKPGVFLAKVRSFIENP